MPKTTMNRMFCGNVDYEATDAEIRDFLVDLGITPYDLKVPRFEDTGEGKGFCFFETEKTLADTEASIRTKKLNGRYLRLSEAIDKPRPTRGDRDRDGARPARRW